MADNSSLKRSHLIIGEKDGNFNIPQEKNIEISIAKNRNNSANDNNDYPLKMRYIYDTGLIKELSKIIL